MLDYSDSCPELYYGNEHPEHGNLLLSVLIVGWAALLGAFVQ